eukprot:TRINITY_DN14340_c0_g1_i2.p1 TRINITY_DN14340_c0_g1~~TRINITY_DN14340_c0_g1_i2.p1  ORF type:complete len:353 (+),score=51.01 TRINITY_DN14340_c0_g1_i2:91-1149(+)
METDTEEDDGDSSSDSDKSIFEVERVLDSRTRHRRREYLVKWKGYPMEDCTWEPLSNFFDKSPIQEFESNRKTGKKRSAIPRSSERSAKRPRNGSALKLVPYRDESSSPPSASRVSSLSPSHPSAALSSLAALSISPPPASVSSLSPASRQKRSRRGQSRSTNSVQRALEPILEEISLINSYSPGSHRSSKSRIQRSLFPHDTAACELALLSLSAIGSDEESDEDDEGELEEPLTPEQEEERLNALVLTLPNRWSDDEKYWEDRRARQQQWQQGLECPEPLRISSPTPEPAVSLGSVEEGSPNGFRKSLRKRCVPAVLVAPTMASAGATQTEIEADLWRVNNLYNCELFSDA